MFRSFSYCIPPLVFVNEYVRISISYSCLQVHAKFNLLLSFNAPSTLGHKKNWHHTLELSLECGIRIFPIPEIIELTILFPSSDIPPNRNRKQASRAIFRIPPKSFLQRSFDSQLEYELLIMLIHQLCDSLSCYQHARLVVHFGSQGSNAPDTEVLIARIQETEQEDLSTWQQRWRIK